MNAFKMSWNTEGGRLACRWVDSKQSGKCYRLSIFDHLRVSDDPWNQSTRPFELSGRTRTWPGCLIGHIFPFAQTTNLEMEEANRTMKPTAADSWTSALRPYILCVCSQNWIGSDLNVMLTVLVQIRDETQFGGSPQFD